MFWGLVDYGKNRLIPPTKIRIPIFIVCKDKIVEISMLLLFQRPKPLLLHNQDHLFYEVVF